MKRISLFFLVLSLALTLCACGADPGKDSTAASTDNWVVTFNPRDRDQAVTQIEVRPGEKAEKPADPVRPDHVFTGWYTDKRAAGDLYDFDAPVTDDLFLYAGWTSTKVRVIFDPNYEGGDVVTASLDGGVRLTEDQLPRLAERENYAFLGWFKDIKGREAYDFSQLLTKDLTLYGAWRQLVATAAFDIGYFGGVSPETQEIDLTAGGKVREPETPVRGEEGDWRFDGWFVGGGRNEALYDFDAEVTGDVSLRAKWTMQRATVTYDVNAGGTDPVTEKVAIGETAAQWNQITREGYDFSGWFYDKDCTAPADLSTLAVTDDLTVYAAWTAQKRTIAFSLNYEGAPQMDTVESLYDDITVEPEEPARAGDEFIGWFLDSEQTQPFAFGSPLKDNLTLYAGWESKTAKADTPDAAQTAAGTDDLVTADGKLILRFFVNDGTDAVYQEEEVAKNKYSAMRRSGVTYPVREGYMAFGWYTTPDCQDGTEFNPNSRVTAGANLYVKWVKEYVFEAELTQLTEIPIGDTGKTEEKLGFGESSNPKGLFLIEWDCYDAGASNDYYVSYLYNPGSYLEFCITAMQAVENATLVLRLTPELHDMYFLTGGPDGSAAEKNGYKVYVNPVYSFNSVTNKEVLESYEQVFDLNADLTGAVTKDEDPNYTRKRAFEDYTITTDLHLHAGDNIIRLVTDNTHDYGGSMHAAAPMVDCIKIYTNVGIGWTEGKEFTKNLEGIDVRWPAKNQ